MSDNLGTKSGHGLTLSIVSIVGLVSVKLQRVLYMDSHRWIFFIYFLPCKDKKRKTIKWFSKVLFLCQSFYRAPVFKSIIDTKKVKKLKLIFLAPSGAQGVTMCVCLSLLVQSSQSFFFSLSGLYQVFLRSL